MKKIQTILLLMMLAISTAQAQVFFGANEFGAHSLSMRAVGFSGGLNYNYRWPIEWLNRDLNIQFEIDTPLILASDLDSWLVEGSLGAMLYKDSAWNVGLYYGESTATAKNILGSYLTKSSNLTLQPGYYRPNWFVAADLRLLTTVFTYIEHSDRHKDFYSDIPNAEASDSVLIRFPNRRYLTGFVGAYTTDSHKWSFIGSIGALLVPQAQGVLVFPEVNLLPFYFTLDIARHF